MRVFAMLLAFSLSGHALADELAPTPTPQSDAVATDAADRARSARTHFDAGMAHYRSARFREAIREFSVAANLVPSADLWFNIARSYEQLSAWEEAAEHYRRYLRDRVDPPDRDAITAHVVALDERAEAERQSRRVAPTNGAVRVDADPPGATISVGERALGPAPLAESVSLPAGPHIFRLDADDVIPARSEVRVEAGVTTTVVLSAPPSTRYRSVRGTRLWTWVVAGVAGAGAATSIGLGVHAKLELDDARYGSARAWANRSDAVLVGALVTAVGAVILYFLEGRAVSSERVGGQENGVVTAEASGALFSF